MDMFESRWNVNGISLTFCSTGIALGLDLDITDPKVIDAFNKAKSIYPNVRAVAELDDLNGRWDEAYIRQAPDDAIDDLMRNIEIARANNDVTIPDRVQWIIDIVSDEYPRRVERRRRKAEKAAPKRPISGFLYLVQSPTGTYKIGRTRNIHNRMETFNVKLPFEVNLLHIIECLDYRSAERVLHDKFADKRLNGSEFFALTDEDVAYIRAIERM